MTSEIANVTDETFKSKVIDSIQPVLVDFWAPSCAPCMTVTKTLESLAGVYSEKITMYKMNLDENADIPTEYGIRALPYLAVFKGGKLVDSILGAVPKAKITIMLDKILNL